MDRLTIEKIFIIEAQYSDRVPPPPLLSYIDINIIIKHTSAIQIGIYLLPQQECLQASFMYWLIKSEVITNSLFQPCSYYYVLIIM